MDLNLLSQFLGAIGSGMARTNSYGAGLGIGADEFRQKQQYGQTIDSLFGTPQVGVSKPMPAPQMQQRPQSLTDTSISPQTLESITPKLSTNYDGPLGGAANLLPLLKGVDPSIGMPMLLKMATTQSEYDPTPRYDQSGRAFIVGKNGAIKYLDGVSDRPDVKVENGIAYDPHATPAGTVFPNPNKPFNVDGTPNKAFQDWELKKAKTGSEASTGAGWQLLVDPKTNTPYRYNVRTGQALDFSGNTYTPEGASHVASGQVRSPTSVAVQRFMQEHPDATAQDVSQFAADFGSTGKSVGAFSTGKQGDLIRSFNVGISHLNTLDGLVDALGNNDMQTFNKIGNAVAAQTGNPAPTNFDAAKAIVGDEIIKAIVGGGGALADRENAQNQIDRANSPQQLRGVINTYKKLMAGQLSGLKKQYTDTTHRDNFDSRLSPEARSELENEGGSPATKFNTKTIGAKTYVNKNGQWYEQ